MAGRTITLRFLPGNSNRKPAPLPVRVESAAQVVRALYWSAPRRHPLRLVPKKGA